ncbi:10861_t:CDS:1, partial [Funneliformis caledonium]
MSRNSRLDDALELQSNLLETIFKEQELDLYSESNFSIYIKYSNTNINTDTNTDVVIITKLRNISI